MLEDVAEPWCDVRRGSVRCTVSSSVSALSSSCARWTSCAACERCVNVRSPLLEWLVARCLWCDGRGAGYAEPTPPSWVDATSACWGALSWRGREAPIGMLESGGRHGRCVYVRCVCSNCSRWSRSVSCCSVVMVSAGLSRVSVIGVGSGKSAW